MIDIETLVFQKATNPLRIKYPGILITQEFIDAPSKFPAVCFEEKDNSVYQKSQDENIENHANLMYEINVYSNKQTGKKAECKSIMNDIDFQMATIGFTRTFMQPIPNLEDGSKYRITARYKGVADKNNIIYRR